MKIALYVHCFFPAHFYGTEAYTLALAKELIALGHYVTVVSATFAGEPPQGSFVEESVYEGVPVLSIDKNHYPNRSVRDTYEQPSLRHVHERILRKLKPDVVHVCHLISHTTALLEVTHRLGIPTFATFTDFFGCCYNNRLENAEEELCSGPNESRSNCIACFLKLSALAPNAQTPERLANLPLVRPVVSRALVEIGRRSRDFSVSGFAPSDVVERPDILRQAYATYREAIAPTRFLKEAYERNGVPVPMRLSHFGIEIDRSPKPPRPAPDQVRLGFVGQIVPHKGAHVLLDALRAAERPNLLLTIWGPSDQDRPYFESLRMQAEGLPVTFAGTVARDDLSGALAGIDYLVIPSTWYENSPLILLQALATHTPVIVSDVLGMTEFVEHGRNGFHFERGNAAALTQVLRRVADDPGLAMRMSADTAYPRTFRDMAQDVVDLYRDHVFFDGVAETSPSGAAEVPADDPAAAGIEGPLEPWLKYNAVTAFAASEPAERVAPFAPPSLMIQTTGLSEPRDFAGHGVDIIRALAAVSPKPLADYRSWFDFGIGVGRVARMFKGFTGLYAGVDIDPETVAWVRENLPWVRAYQTRPRQPFPFPDELFEAAVSISVFSHMAEAESRFYLSEIRRITRPGAQIMITVHGRRAIERALAEPKVLQLLDIPLEAVAAAQDHLENGSGFHFTRQLGHLTSDDYAYGITFMGRRWIDAVWPQWFDVVDVVEGGIHGFQDIVVARRR